MFSRSASKSEKDPKTSIKVIPEEPEPDSDDDDDTDDEEVYDMHSLMPISTRSSMIVSSQGLLSAAAQKQAAWAKADSLCYVVSCNDRFLKICGITRADVANGISIINLVKQSTPEKMMQQAYQLDELISGKVDASMKWSAELNEMYKDTVYTLNVTLADQLVAASMNGGKPYALDVVLKPAGGSDLPQGHQVVNGHLEWGLRRRSSVNILDRRMSGLFRSGKDLMREKEPTQVAEAAPQLRVLLVDDSLLALKVLSKLIVAEGHHVDTRRRGEDALELLKTDHFDAVLITMVSWVGWWVGWEWMVGR